MYLRYGTLCLTKSVAIKINRVTTPWFATANPETRYLINEIVVAEESDLTIDGRRQSHYEMYIEAMRLGQVLWKLKVFLEKLFFTKYFVAIKTSNLHPNIKAFLDFTFSVIEQGKPQIAAAFTLVEDLIPSMFTEILKNFQTNFPDTDLKKFIISKDILK
jgi:hypothetical protein